MKELLRRLFLKPGLSLEIAIASLFANILALAAPLFVIQVLNRYIAHGVDATLATLTSGVILAIILELFFRQIRARLARSISAGANAELALASFSILIKAKASALERIPPGQRSQVVNAPSAVESAYSAGNISAVFDVPFALLFVGVLFLLSPVLSGIVGVFLVVVFIGSTLGSMSMQSHNRNLLQASGAGNAIIGTATRQIDTVRAFNAASFLRHAWENQLARVLPLRSRMEARQNLIQTLTQTAAALMSVFVVAIGATLVVAGQLDVGAMIGANILAARALMPISKFSQLSGVFAKASQSLELLREFAKLPLEADSGSYRSQYTGGLEFRDAAFSFPSASTPLFESLSVTIRPGTVTVVTGANGTGKTTLARIMAGILDPVRGQVLIDGLDLRQTSPEWWRRQIIYFPQEPYLLNGTIRDSLQTSNPDLEEKDLGLILASSGLTNFLDESPNGLETQIADNGANLSLGIRRRLALARALTTDGKLAIFDEPTEGLDTDGIASINAVMQELATKGNTIIVLSHDPRIVSAAHMTIDLNAKPMPQIIENSPPSKSDNDETGNNEASS